MYNPIEAKREFVKAQIQKSFDSEINVADEIELEKAHKDGDHHPSKPWVWVSSANGGKGDWRVEGGRAHKKAGASTSETATGSKVDITKIPDAEFKRITQTLEKNNPDHTDASRYLEEEAMSDKELANFHAVAEHFKNSGKINKLTQEYCRKWAELAKQEMQYRKKSNSSAKNQTLVPASRKPGSTDEIERMNAAGVRSSILGLNNIATNVKDNGDHFKIDFDANDFNTNGKRSPQIDRIAKFLESMGASCVIGNNSIKAYKKVEAKKDSPAIKTDYKSSDVFQVSKEEWEVGSSKDKCKIRFFNTESSFAKNMVIKYVDDKGKDAEIKISGSYGKDYPISSNRITDDFVENVRNGKEDVSRMYFEGKAAASKFALKFLNNRGKQFKKSDPRDKIANDAGFKDYEEMKGYQDYVTQKNLLKKKLTSAGMRLLYQQEVDKYEKDHADLIKRIGKK